MRISHWNAMKHGAGLISIMCLGILFLSPELLQADMWIKPNVAFSSKEAFFEDLEKKETASPLEMDLQAFLRQVDTSDADQKWNMFQDWLDRRIQQNPEKKEDVLYFRSNTRMSLGEFEAAYADVKELCLKMNTSKPDVWIFLAYLEQLHKNEKEAEEYLKNALFLMEPQIKENFEKGTNYFEDEKYSEAEEAFSWCIVLANRIFPDNRFFYEERGTVFFRMGDIQSAHHDFLKAVSGRGVARSRHVIQKFWKMESMTREQISLVPLFDYFISKDPQGIYFAYRACSKANGNDFRGAQEDLERAAEKEPDSLERKYVTIETYILMLEIGKAGELYRTLSQAEQETPEFAHIRGRLALKEERYADAVQEFQNSIEYCRRNLQESLSFVYVGRKYLAMCLGCMGRKREALDVIQSTNCPASYHLYDDELFLIYRELGMEKEMGEIMERAEETLQSVKRDKSVPIPLSCSFYFLWMAEHQRSSEIIDDVQQGYEETQNDKMKLPYQPILSEILAYHFRTKETECQKIIQNAKSTPDQITEAQNRLKLLETRRKQPAMRLEVGNLFRLYAKLLR